MNNPLHDDAGKELIFDDTPSIYDAEGNPRKLGALIPDLTLSASFPLFEDSAGVPLLTDDQIKDYIVNGGKPRSGRVVFGDDWVRNQGQYGSCNGWASACALERARVRRGLKRVQLSGSSVYSRVNGGRITAASPKMRWWQCSGTVRCRWNVDRRTRFTPVSTPLRIGRKVPVTVPTSVSRRSPGKHCSRRSCSGSMRWLRSMLEATT